MKNWLDFFVCKTRKRSSLAYSRLKILRLLSIPIVILLITEMHENDLHNELYRTKTVICFLEKKEVTNCELYRNWNIGFSQNKCCAFAAGFNTFSILYCTQAILPEFSRKFGISPAFASLSLSLTTITLAVSMLFRFFIGSVGTKETDGPIVNFCVIAMYHDSI